ncbi:MAG: hypothetical protein LBJ12_02970 [Oscillospiraceae bacterium]|nr:hypothetical protein [Oscillospiraceae bacterium]
MATAAGYVLDETEHPIVFDYDSTKGATHFNK